MVELVQPKIRILTQEKQETIDQMVEKIINLSHVLNQVTFAQINKYIVGLELITQILIQQSRFLNLQEMKNVVIS
jgi:hypothetical protein